MYQSLKDIKVTWAHNVRGFNYNQMALIPWTCNKDMLLSRLLPHNGNGWEKKIKKAGHNIPFKNISLMT